MNLDELIKDALENIEWHQQKLAEYKIKLSAYYTARDVESEVNHKSKSYDVQ